MPFLQFKGKAAVETYHHTVPHHTLELDRKLSVLGKGEEPGLDGNLIIEGDNLLALKALLPTHAGRVKCIYIDPPYNTGNEGWVYNDNLTQPQFKEWIGQTVGKDEEDACRHDKWCCMMYPRLQLLKQLLTEDGLLFVSIDDTEIDNLRMMLEEILPGGFIASLVWKARQYPDARAKTGVSTDHEYIIVYGRAPGCALRGGERDESKYANPDGDKRGRWMSRSILGLASTEKRPNLHYTLVDPATARKYDPPTETGWRYEKPTMAAKLAEGRILFPKEPTGRPREKVFLEELATKYPGFPSILLEPYTADGTKEIREIFGSGVFPFPKPSELIRFIVEQSTDEGEIVLDSCAGSGTTAHAVLLQQSKDGIGRKFVLIQQPHETKEDEAKQRNICAEITAERVRRVIKGYPFTGRQTEVLLEEKVALTALKKADELLARIETVKQANAGKFDEITSECKDGVVRVLGVKEIKDKTEGLGGSFTYARLSAQPLFGEYRNLGEALPPYEEIAKYVFYTETSRQWSPKGMNKKTGFIGTHAGRSYYLLYHPSAKRDWALDMEFLREVAAKDDNREIVVYCEKIWAHRSDRSEWEQQTGKRLRAMLVPFNLK